MSLICVIVLPADGLKMVHFAALHINAPFYINPFFPFLLLKPWQSPAGSIQHRYDYVLWQERVHTSLCLWARVHAGIGVCPTWRSQPMECLTEAVSFSRDTDREVSPNDRRPARAFGGFCSYHQVEVAADPRWPTSFFLTWVTVHNYKLLFYYISFTSLCLCFLLLANTCGEATFPPSLPLTVPGRFPGARQRSTVFLCFSRA